MNVNKKSRWFYFKKNLPLTLMALPGVALMVLFKYLPLSGIILAFKKYNIRDGIFGSAWNGLKNFEYLFKTKDAWIITRNTLGYNLLFIVLDLVLAVTMAIVLNELHQKKTAKVFPVLGCGFLYRLFFPECGQRFYQPDLRAGCHLVFPEIGMACYPDCFPDMEDAWILHGHVSGFYCGNFQ